MIAYGVCVGPSSKYEEHLGPSLDEYAAGSPVLTRSRQRSIAEAYNSIIDQARELPDLEWLVLLHDDVELTGDLRAPLAEATANRPDVGVVGAVGGTSFRGARWWLTDERHGRLRDGQTQHDYGRGPAAVDAVDGLLLAFPADLLPTLQFDERYRGFHLYDADISRQLLERGRSPVAIELPLIHHSKPGFGHAGNFYREEARYLSKWRLHHRPRGAIDLLNAQLRILWCAVRHHVFRGRP